MSTLLTNYPNTFAFIQIHWGDSFAIPWGPIRCGYYGFTGYPLSIFDGTLFRSGAQSYATYLADYNSRRATPTDVTITLTGWQVTGQTYRFRAHVCIETGGAAKTMRIYMAHVLDHWPYEISYSRNGVRQVGPLADGSITDITLSPGQCQDVEHSFTFDAVSWGHQNDIRVIAWAQEPQASGGSGDRAIVHQAAIVSWPFMIDCNGNGIPDDQDISSGYSHDCNSNTIPDECDIRDCAQDPACGDCNDNDYPDSCDGYNLTDCNGDFISDQCQVQQGLVPDCNNNGIPDSCDIASHYSNDCDLNGVPDECDPDCNSNGTPDACDITAGTSSDCNRNYIPDECDSANCGGAPWCSDCNSNGILDYCDLSPYFQADSLPLSPLGNPTVQTFTVANPPDAAGTVTLNFSAYGDLNLATEYVDVKINNVTVGRIYNTAGYLDCTPGQLATLTWTAAQYNAALAGGNAAISMTPSTAVHPINGCDPQPTYIQVSISYTAVATSLDANSNGIPDECEMAPPVCRGDCNCDGAVGFGDIDLFVAAIPANQANWATKYQLYYGVTPPAGCWDNTDVNGVGTHCGFDDIDPFVKLIPTPCTPRACCFPDHSCQDLIPGQCLIAGGTFTAGPAGDKPCSQTTCP